MFGLFLIEKPCDLYLVGCICAYPFSATTVDAHCPDKMEREAGIEPATFSLARRCSTTEPLPLVTIPLTGVLPLKQEAEIWAMRDSNSHGSRQQILSLPCLPVSAIAQICVWESVEFPHLWMIHQRLDYCQDNFSHVPIGLAGFACRACCEGGLFVLLAAQNSNVVRFHVSNIPPQTTLPNPNHATVDAPLLGLIGCRRFRRFA